ncbi:MAG: hypothetical protein JSS44_09005 [Proteobacteria bacterium]|nr:hypothetical protein [Pseudomonadota bacterium]MBS0461761.1 hypothetical protein [Pseudomonadota bacterium]
MSQSLTDILATIEQYLPTIGALVAALDPKDAATVALVQKLASIVAELAATERQIMAGLSPALMEQIAQANRDADAGLIGN